MFDGVDYVRSVCERHGVAVSKLEKDCGFSNGYLNPKKLKKIPYDRAITIAKYLSRYETISAEYIMTGKEKAPTPEGEREERNIRAAKVALFGGDTEVTDEMWQEAVFAAELIKERHKRKKD